MKKNTPLLLIFITVFVDLLGFGILIPILPAFAKKILFVDEAAIGAVIAIYSLTQFLFNPILGRLSDKFGRKPVIVVSLFINAIGYLIFAFTTSYTVLLLSRVIAGIGGSSVSVAQAYIADVTTKENRAKGMGLIGAAFGLGFVFGPLIGGLLSNISYMVTGFGAASFSLLAFTLTILLLPEPERKFIQTDNVKKKLIDFDAIKNVFKNPERKILIISFFILTFSFANIYGTFALLGIQEYHFTDMQNGMIFGILGLVSAIVQGGLVGKAHKLLGKKNILRLGSLLMMLSLILLPYAGSFSLLAVVSVFLACGTGLFQPTIISLVSEVTPEAEQGVTLGVNQSMSSLARVFGPLWGGFTYEYFGYQYPFLTGALFTFFIFIITIYILPKRLKFK